MFAQECFDGSFIGVDFGIYEDLSGKFPERWHDFNAKFIPVWLEQFPGKSKVAAGLSCGTLWTLGRGIEPGDVVVSPDGNGVIHFGTVEDGYYYAPDGPLPHRRHVRWSDRVASRSELSPALQSSMRSMLTISELSTHADEILAFVGGHPAPVVAADPTIEDPSMFALEAHLESFLIENWDRTELGAHYDIFSDETGLIGRQYMSDTGPMDILAISKDKRELLVIELKRGRASDAVVGQIQRYMGYVQSDLAEADQRVRGVIIALDDDLRIRRALAVAPSIDFYRYRIDFALSKVDTPSAGS